MAHWLPNNTQGIGIDFQGKVEWKCQWNLNSHLFANGGPIHAITLDLVAKKSGEISTDYCSNVQNSKNHLTHVSRGNIESSKSMQSEKARPAEEFLMENLRAASDNNLNEVIVKFLIPSIDGYVVKSDFLERRFESKGWLVSGFVTPLMFVKALPDVVSKSADLSKLLSFAIGAFLLDASQPGLVSEVEIEIQRRLEFPWLSISPIEPKTLAIVQDPASLLPARRRWQAAASLGIKLILVSSSPHVPGEKDLFESIFESYVAVDMSTNAGLAQRIADCLRPLLSILDGIFATKDHRLTAVAEAAELLGIFTSPSDAYERAGDKFSTRITEPDVETTFLVESAEELDSLIHNLGETPFPLVVKPCRGDSSQHVSKVSNERGLREATEHALAFANPARALVEPYVSGPEVDVNFVLLDGQVLFAGVCDNFPSEADNVKSDGLLYFAETKNLSPSLLPKLEQDLLVSHFHQTLIRQGFHSGIFHVEGRVKDSATQYLVDESGSIDLQSRPVHDNRKPSAFLHEINARPPGFQCCAAFLLCFRIDFWALQMLTAAQDWERLKALANPIPEGTRDHLSVENLHCTVTEAAVKAMFPDLDTANRKLHFMGDPMPELREYNAQMNAEVVQCQVCINSGEVYGGNGWLWLATFVVASRKGRREALMMSDRMVQKYRAAVQAISGMHSVSGEI